MIRVGARVPDIFLSRGQGRVQWEPQTIVMYGGLNIYNHGGTYTLLGHNEHGPVYLNASNSVIEQVKMISTYYWSSKDDLGATVFVTPVGAKTPFPPKTGWLRDVGEPPTTEQMVLSYGTTGSDMIVNGEFASMASWSTAGTGTMPYASGGVCIWTGGQDPSSYQQLFQIVAGMTVGKSYEAVMQIPNRTSGKIKFRCGYGTNSAWFDQTGGYVLADMLCVGNGHLYIQSEQLSGPFIGEIDKVMMRELSAEYLGA